MFTPNALPNILDIQVRMAFQQILSPASPSTDDINSLQLYQFDRLTRSDTIRVLTLLPTTYRLEFTFQEAIIKHSDYQALSYVWGSSETPSRAVVLDKAGRALGYIPLTFNLDIALRDLRDSAEIESKLFWIDQVSIDQNSDEKGQQVAMMGDIYTYASRVITYLGPAVQNSHIEASGIQLLYSLYNHFLRTMKRSTSLGLSI